MRDWKSTASCTDGTSNTIAIGEIATADLQDNRLLKGSMAIGLAWAPVASDPEQCYNQVNSSDRTRYSATYVSNVRGTQWGNAKPARTGFTTILPPNGPSCTSGSGGTTNDTNGNFAAASHHPGGIQIGLADASVRFLSETINCKTIGASPNETPKGASPYGVWGALGSPDGGETTSLP